MWRGWKNWLKSGLRDPKPQTRNSGELCGKPKAGRQIQALPVNGPQLRSRCFEGSHLISVEGEREVVGVAKKGLHQGGVNFALLDISKHPRAGGSFESISKASHELVILK